MRIFDRLASGESVLPWDAATPRVGADIAWRKAAHECVRVVADNAAEYLEDRKLEGDTSIEAFGSILPSFPRLWIEWVDHNGLRAMVIDSSRDDYGLFAMHAGMLWTPDDRGTINVLPVRSVAVSGIADGGEVACLHNTYFQGEESPMWGSHFLPGWLAMAWMNCKNLSLEIQTVSDRIAKKRRRKGHFLGHDYYRIEVSMAHRKKWEKAAGVSATKFHSVKGSQATYTDTNPMFGIPGRTGSYWRPSHVRGDKKLGSINKEYQVERPSL